jgi:predicted ArsR family transcriptional regulator
LIVTVRLTGDKDDTLSIVTTGTLDEYDLWLLEAAVDGPASIEELSASGRVPKSTAYRRVPVLERRGLVESERRDSGVGRPALVYTITVEGVAELEAFVEGLQGTLDRITNLISKVGDNPQAC